MTRNSYESISCDFNSYTDAYFPDTSKILEVTLVTAFFDLGSFAKGDKNNVYTPTKYKEWMHIFENIHNPLYVYVDSEEYQKFFETIRRNMTSKTKVILIDRDSLESFRLKDNISAIFSNPKYPKHLPNTVIPEYSCAMHAKYDVMTQSVRDNAFNTNFFAWLDIGYFRDLVNTTYQPFQIHLPPCFDVTKVAFNEIFSLKNRTLRQIVDHNEVWVGGGLFFAERSVMLQWARDYKYYTEKFIHLGLMSTDQQVIYAMRQPTIHKELGKRRVAIQEYHVKYVENNWFGLGYLCKKQITL